MKQIIAYIRPAMLERVTEALRLIDGLTGMSVMEIKGFGRGKGSFHTDQGESEISRFGKKIRIEVMVTNAFAEQVVETIREKAWTGEQGEGKIYVLNVENAVRIRTNERGEGAI